VPFHPRETIRLCCIAFAVDAQLRRTDPQGYQGIGHALGARPRQRNIVGVRAGRRSLCIGVALNHQTERRRRQKRGGQFGQGALRPVVQRIDATGVAEHALFGPQQLNLYAAVFAPTNLCSIVLNRLIGGSSSHLDALSGHAAPL